jgi:hypothetical protein
MQIAYCFLLSAECIAYSVPNGATNILFDNYFPLNTVSTIFCLTTMS